MEILGKAGAPVSSARLARELLGFVNAPERACSAVLTPILGGDPRFTHAAGDGWRLRRSDQVAAFAVKEEDVHAGRDEADRPAPSDRWAVWAVDRELRGAAVVLIEKGERLRERCERGAGIGTRGARRDGQRGGVLSKSALRRLARCASGARWASFAPGATLRRLRRALTAAGASVPDVPAIGLQRLGLAILGPPRAASLEDLGRRLGLRVLDSDDSLARAREAADCLLRLFESSVSVKAACGKAPPCGFDTASLRDLPASPGVYRFLSKGGELLYVGKAANVRRRVGSYFHRRLVPDPRTAAWIDRVHRIEIERAGSEAEALVRESEAITRLAPAVNRQRLVHERPLRQPEHVVLLLPAARHGIVHAHVIRRGTHLARIPLGPRGGGQKRLLILFRHLLTGADAAGTSARNQEADSAGRPSYPAERSNLSAGRDHERPEAKGCRDGERGHGTPRSARGRGGGSTCRAGRESSAPRAGAAETAGRRRAAILSSWLARQDGPAAAFDPTDAASPEDALALALAYAASVRRGETDVVYRA